MYLAAAILAIIAGLALLLFGISRAGAAAIERCNPPSGSFAEANGTHMHFVHVPAPAEPELPPVLFLHGASGNLRDQMVPLRPLLEGRAELLFVDRPGHGWSERGEINGSLDGQVRTIAALMDRLGMQRAIVVGHSFGAAVAACFALEYPDRTAGLVFLAAASHPWPDRKTSWYYPLTARRYVGWLFSELLALPVGVTRIAAATVNVFSPNPVPEGYRAKASIDLVLRPRHFRANAVDVEGLYDHVSRAAPLYPSIAVPTVVISGDRDAIVYEEIHSLGLARDIPGAELVWVRNLGHKPDWIAPDLVAAAIAKTAGQTVDLQALAGQVESRIASDDYGAPERAEEDKTAEAAELG
jgi:pimeloyl-ACP methyl ester carboxylesterase